MASNRPAVDPAHLTRLTYRRERWRSACAGILETGGNTFLLLIAVRHFQAGALAKALIAAGTAVGLLLSPVAINVVHRLGWAPTTAVARFFLLGAAACAAMAAIPGPVVFVTGSVIALAVHSAAIPLLTQVYQDNYPADRRGKLYSRTFMLRIASAVAFALLAGQVLEPDPALVQRLAGDRATAWLAAVESHPGRFRWLLLAFAAAFVVAARAVGGIPSRPAAHPAGAHPFHGLRFIRQDRMFRQALIAWMLMGFANLAMLPLRVEYLGNPRYGLVRTAPEIALLTLVIPNVARMLLSPVWGWLFDRMNFFTLRITLNVGFALGIAAFFTSDSTAGLVVGAIVYGISTAGGDVAWNLWVTKLAPPAHVTDYMAVHTFLTGIRGVLAPVLAFQAIRHFSLAGMGWACAAMILGATLILVPEMRAWRRRG